MELGFEHEHSFDDKQTVENINNAQLDQTWSKRRESFWLSRIFQSSSKMCQVAWLFHLEMGSPTLFHSSTDIRNIDTDTIDTI